MGQYAEEHDILSKPRVILVGNFRGVNILLATSLLRCYLAHGLVVDRVYQIIEYEPNPCVRQLGRADRRAHYFRHRSQWLPAECCDEHEHDYVRARIAGRPWTATESC